jgi:hypothetical protein
LQSTLLRNTARELVSRVDAAGKPKEPTPTCLVSIRLNSSREAAPTPTKDAEATSVFSQTAAKILRQIGAPPRRALIYNLLPSGVVFKSENVKMPVGIRPSGERVEQMLELLFETAAEISTERLARGLPAETAVTVLLWDEVRVVAERACVGVRTSCTWPGAPGAPAALILSRPCFSLCSALPLQLHDLIKDSRYAKAGGSSVFQFLARQMVDYGITKKLVRSVVTGSTAELVFKLGDTSVASGERVETYELQDPPEADVKEALVKAGYSEADAARIVQSVGARMRFLDAPLGERQLIPADELIRKREDSATLLFQGLFTALGRLQDGGITRAAVVKLLDDVEAAQAAADAQAAAGSTTGCSAAHFPTWMQLPQAAISADISRVIFVDKTGRVVFQSCVHRRVWRAFRGSVVTAAGTASSSAGS